MKRSGSVAGVFVLLGALGALGASGCSASPADGSSVANGGRTGSGGGSGDGGGQPELHCDDADGDGISDEDEGKAEQVDTDGDGTADYRDDDSDGDGIPDATERGNRPKCYAPADSNNDGEPDFRSLDADGNGIPDGEEPEALEDPDGDGIPNFADLDDDGDRINDVVEIGGDPKNPLDTDGDGTPDYRDTDSDGDTILDKFEGDIDSDQDGTPNYLDIDSDEDCVPDSAEAGGPPRDPTAPPLDTDGDSIPDYLDSDSDNDGLTDGEEDANCSGALDTGESDPLNGDTDGDGVSDLVEHAAGTDPTEPSDNPTAHGNFFFLVPYQEPPTPDRDALDFSTKITVADVVFSMDTTGSMGIPIANMKSNVASIATKLASPVDGIANVALGVVDFRDFQGGGGYPGDWPFLLRHRVMTVRSPAGLASIQSAVNLYQAVNYAGGDLPESGWEALYQIATGAGTTVAGANVAPFDPASAPPATIPAGEDVGTIGGVGFRAGALPIVVHITDAPTKNTVGHLKPEALAAYGGIGGKFVGISTNTNAATRNDLTDAARSTDSRVPPSAWDGARPASCAVGQCCTGNNGAGESPDADGLCPLSLVASGSVSDVVVSAIKALTNYATLDIGALAQDDVSDAIDAVLAFVDKLEANTTSGAPCTPGLPVEDRLLSDGVNDTFPKVMPGTRVCFDILPRQNTTVPATDKPQLFKAFVTVWGNGVTQLETREVYFLVPPVIPPPPGGVIK